MACSQVVLTELVLGIAGVLTVTNLILLNSAISFAVLLYLYKWNKTTILEAFTADVAAVKTSLREGLDTYNLALLLVLLPAYGWILFSSYFLPPRGVDDLVYHLPPVFEYIQSHAIKLLPVQIRHHFAYPQNGELLFIWPTIFSHSIKMLTSVNVPFALMSIAAVYALLRKLDISRRNALFASMLYALCPVVLMQSGSNYIDVMVSLMFLICLYYSLLYFENQNPVYLFSAAMAVGLVCGMKYTAVFMTLPLQILMISKMYGKRWCHAAGYLTIVMVLCSWWYVRNIFVLGSPLFPMNVFVSGLGFMGGSGQAHFIDDMLANVRYWALHFPMEDAGLGTCHGGFGLVFWGLGFSSWLCISVYSILNLRKTPIKKFIVLLHLPLGFLMLLMFPPNELPFATRMSMFVVAVGLFALCEALKAINDQVYVSIIKIACILFSIVTVSSLSLYGMPNFRLDRVFQDKSHNISTSDYKYIMDSHHIYAKLKTAWEPLDYLTREGKKGLNCYFAAEKALFIMSPLYGSRLQNSIANMSSDMRGQEDAFVYFHTPDDDKTFFLKKPEMYYLNYKVPLLDTLSNPDYVVVTQTEYGIFIIKKDYLRDPKVQTLLQMYYKNTWPEAILSAGKMAGYLKEAIPIVASDEIGYGIRYLELSGNLPERVLLVQKQHAGDMTRKRNIKRCYSVGNALPGFRSKKVVAASTACPVDAYINYID